MADIAQGGSPDGMADIESMLTGTSGMETTGGAFDQSPTQGGTPQQTPGQTQQTGFQFGGRTFPSQKEAEKVFNQIYGKYSDTQGVLNKLKTAITKDPSLISKLAQNPEYAPILAKLGIQQAEEEAEELEAQGGEAGQESDLAQQVQLERASMSLEREEWRFERKLGRNVTDDEHDAVMQIIGKAPSLSYDEAWKLAFHDKMLKEASLKAKAPAKGQHGNRPAPPPALVPGSKAQAKKDPRSMNASEWREHLRNSEEFQNLMSRER